MREQTILFDLDDTLVHCNKYFDFVIDQFVDLMLTWYAGHNLKQEDIRQKQQQIDLAGIHIHGFKPERFPQSFVETYQWFAQHYNRPVSHKEQDWLMQLGHTVYSYTVEPYPLMNETLQELKDAGHRLFLYTGGDVSIQKKKIKDVGLDLFFQDRIFVTVHKTKAFMNTLMHEQQFQREHTWMIGNSITTDVLPALHAGIHAIHIPVAEDWIFNQGTIDIAPKGAFYQLPSLQEVPEAIEGYLQKSM
ncbi:HAD family hydrolase [Paenibacillus roseipurpureus]|uniref:HAD family hydrolase n=1 Tax=Paenibacillus roseopurpureus TaxID=2918901 RepID=A0AA96RK42_9BACL|nr:HAD family hydrolase [Paenibacillus sp. MBLB1832]WNR43924.1 HAD family hydrolase [Paenibacillus sp. MBLB1832]